MRIGFGYDVHPLVPGRKLILGGVEIPCRRGVAGHSDADVLVHALCDALLGAAALGDLGKNFPDTDPAYKDISSLAILKKTSQLLKNKNFKVNNIDSTIVMEEPQLAPYIDKMETEIAGVLNVCEEVVSIKATTQEKLGFLGRGEGAAAFAVVLLDEI